MNTTSWEITVLERASDHLTVRFVLRCLAETLIERFWVSRKLGFIFRLLFAFNSRPKQLRL